MARNKAKRKNHQTTGVAGVHFVAARLSSMGFHAVPTTRNVSGPDLLVSNRTGSKLVAIQVKTTGDALRMRGRGSEKHPDHLEWDIGWSSAKLSHKNLVFALVDLKKFDELPDIYLVPSRVIYSYFKGKDWKRARFHPGLGRMKRYKNNWTMLGPAPAGEDAEG